MSYYFVANIKIVNEEEYSKYIDQSEKIFKKYNGEYLLIDDNPKVLEGEWAYTRTVIIRFLSLEDFNDWYYSKDYQLILKFRLDGAICDTILAHGK